MKARKVKDLDPDGLLVDNMRRVILVRLDELHSFIPDALDPEKIEESHDMRIAAKRLRYLLELSEPLFGKPAKKGAKVAKDIQGMLGEIHDCDELLPLVEGHVARMRSEDAAHAVAAAPDDAEDLARRSSPTRPTGRATAGSNCCSPTPKAAARCCIRVLCASGARSSRAASAPCLKTAWHPSSLSPRPPGN